MDEIERQVRAWADAAAVAAGEGDPVGADEVSTAPAVLRPVPRGGRRRLAAAAVVVAVGALAAGVLALTSDDPAPIRTADSTTTTEPEGSTGGDVSFEVLQVGGAAPAPGDDWDEWVGSLPVLQTASTAEQLEELWRGVRYLDPTRSSTPPVPEVDVGERVVVSIVIPGDACPPELQSFRRQALEDGGPVRLVPQFVETASECEQPLVPTQYVVALDWSSTGDRFSVLVDGGNLSGDPDRPTGDARSAEVRLDRARPAQVPIDLELDATTVEAGSTLSGQVVVSNNTGAPIPITYCGAELALGLENDEVDPQMGFNACLQRGVLAPGVTAFDVEVSASYGSCVAVGPDDPRPEGMAECLPGGAIPPLPPGEYRTRLYPPGGLEGVDLDVDELPIIVTAP